MRLAVPLFCCALAFGQNTSSAPETQSQAPANSPDHKSRKQDYGLGTGEPGRQMGGLDILSDTQGVDFGPYLQRILQTVRENWYHLIPESQEMKKGKLAIELAIAKDGNVADMRLVASSGDVALDRPAWGSITASNPFPPLPSEYTGPYLALRFRFYYNPDKSDLDGSAKKNLNEKPSQPTLKIRSNDWTEVRSPHFRVLTNGSISDAKKVAYEFEQLRNVFATRFPNARLESGAPLLVFAVRDEDTAKKLEPRIWKSGNNRAGEFHRGWEKQFAIVRLDAWGGEGSKEVVYHEYTHSIEHLNKHYLPLWLDEGTAEFYAYTRFQSQRIYLGAPTERYRTLRDRTPIPVETFIGLGPRSPYYLDGSQNQLYYAEAWALVHYLIYGDGMENGKRLDQFTNLLQEGVTQKDAFQQAFGDFKKVDRGLGSYMLQPTFRTTILKDSQEIDEKAFHIRVTSIAETEAELGGFHVWTRDLPGARELLDQALKDDPKLALAHQEMGFLNFAEGKDSQAETEFAEAYALDQSLYLPLFYKVMLSPLATSNNVGDMNAFGAMIGKVLQLNSNFAPAYVALVKLALREGDLNSALQISRRAEELEPSLAGYHVLTGQVLKRVGRTADAAAYANFVADRWIGADHDEAVELWNSLPAADRPSLKPASEMEIGAIEKETQLSEGRIKSVSCSDTDNGMSLVLESGGQSLTFRGKGFVTGFSDTLWYGADHFDLCHHLEGRRAVIRYRPAADANYAGEIAELGIRDDLPEPLEGVPPNSATAAAH